MAQQRRPGTPSRPARSDKESEKYEKDVRGEISGLDLIAFLLDNAQDQDKKCMLCQGVVKNISLRDHIENFHLPKETGDPDKKLYHCTICEKRTGTQQVYKRKQGLTEHIRAHCGWVSKNDFVVDACNPV